MSTVSPFSRDRDASGNPHLHHRLAPSVSALIAPIHLPIRDANGEEMSRQLTERPYAGDRSH